jgi:hypothetical protein
MRNSLLTIDGIVNLALGVLLVAFPTSIIRVLGIPGGESAFYANILGGVLFGVGVALMIERFRPPLRAVGLGIGGAISINLCGGAVLAGWLAFGRLELSTVGVIALWALVLLLAGLSVIELLSRERY